jgi:uncharacterized repeat protein (TIGR03803 family)
LERPVYFAPFRSLFVVLVLLTGICQVSAQDFTNPHSFVYISDGDHLAAGLVLSGDILYGTANNGGSGADGVVFKINTDGTGFTNLYSFTALDPTYYINSDGASPSGALICSGNTLYGAARVRGGFNAGTVFSLSSGSLNAPKLAIILSGVSVILMWPTNAIGLTLQSTTGLASEDVWSTVSPAPVVVNGQNTVSDTVSGNQKYYRLIQ